MAKTNPFQSIKLVYHRSSPRLKILVLVMLLVSAAALLALRVALVNYRQQNLVLQSQVIALQEKVQELEANIADLGSKESIRRIAIEELGLVDPDAQFFVPGN